MYLNIIIITCKNRDYSIQKINQIAIPLYILYNSTSHIFLIRIVALRCVYTLLCLVICLADFSLYNIKEFSVVVIPNIVVETRSSITKCMCCTIMLFYIVYKGTIAYNTYINM